MLRCCFVKEENEKKMENWNGRDIFAFSRGMIPKNQEPKLPFQELGQQTHMK